MSDAGTPEDADLWWVDPEGDLGPDSRPSDRPEAADWREPPPESERPCCVLSDPIRLADLEDGLPLHLVQPLVAWGAGRWGLLIQYFDGPPSDGLVLRTLDRVGALVSRIVIEPPPTRPHPTDAYPRPKQLRWNRGRWAIAALTPGEFEEARPFARLFDVAGVPVSEWLQYHDRPGSLVELVPHRGAWLGLSSDSRSLWASPLPPGRTASPMGGVDVVRLRAVGMESRAVALLRSAAHVHSLSVSDGAREQARVSLDTAGPEADIGSLRNLVTVAGWDDDVLRVQVADPFAAEVRTEAMAIATREPRRDGEADPRHSVAVAGSNKHGVTAVCYGIRTGAERGQIRLALVGPDATVRGGTVTVADSWFRFNDLNCSIGSDEEGFLVAWWTGLELWVRRVDVARVP